MTTADVRLVTPRLVIREYAAADVRAVTSISSDPDVVRYVRWGPHDEEATRRFLNDAEASRTAVPRLRSLLAVSEAEGARIVGGCSLEVHRPHDREANIGFYLGRSWWGRGYATELIKALLTWGFEELSLHRISATADVRNVASWRAMERAGMCREGHLRRHMWQRDEWRDSLLYAVVEDERPSGAS